MINSITVTNYLGESLKLEMRFPEKSGFLILSVDGSGPCKANINTTELSTIDGALFNSARTGSRNIVLLLQMLEKPSIEITRQNAYKYFPVKKQLCFEVETDIRTYKIYGYVESNNPVMFSKMVSTQISIICPDPYFYSPEITTTVFSGIDAAFEFPFSNESLNDNLLVIADIINNQAQNVFYEGNTEVGIVIYIHMLGTVEGLAIYNLGTGEKMIFDTDKLATITGSGFITGDNLIISTIKGSKFIKLLRGGIYINIFNCLDKDSDWFQIRKGDNVFYYEATSGSSNLQFRIENQLVYEGV